MKRIFALLLVAVMIMATMLTTSCNLIAGSHLCDECGKCPKSDCTAEGHSTKCICSLVSSELPVYGELEGHEGFHLSVFAEPAQQTVEAYQMLVDLGCNWVYIDPWSGTSLGSVGLAKALEVCEEVGLNAMIMTANGYNTNDNPHTFVSIFDTDIDYTQYPAFKGCYAYDEPNQYMLANYVVPDYERWEQSQYKDYLYMINTCSMPEANETIYDWVDFYWNTFLSKSDDNILMFDKYGLYARVGDKTIPYLREYFIQHLDAYSPVARDNDCYYLSYIQTYAEKDGSAREMVSVNDARWQVAMNLAYGVDGLACFTYLTMNQFGNSMITPNNDPLPAYYYVQEVFAELKEFEDVYFAFDWQGTITHLGPNRGAERGYGEQNESHFTELRNSITSHDRIYSIKTEYDLVVGTFKDDNGYDGFLITSYTDPYYMKDNNIEIDFNNASRALVYLNGTPITNDEAGTCYVLEDGVLKYDLEAGDYLFVVPVK